MERARKKKKRLHETQKEVDKDFYRAWQNQEQIVQKSLKKSGKTLNIKEFLMTLLEKTD